MVSETPDHYRIPQKLGAGGMGEVFRSEDTSLKRYLALQVLPTELAKSQRRLETFQREAGTIADPDHHKSVTIYTVEKSDQFPLLSIQLVEGAPAMSPVNCAHTVVRTPGG